MLNNKLPVPVFSIRQRVKSLATEEEGFVQTISIEATGCVVYLVRGKEIDKWVAEDWLESLDEGFYENSTFETAEYYFGDLVQCILTKRKGIIAGINLQSTGTIHYEFYDRKKNEGVNICEQLVKLVKKSKVKINPNSSYPVSCRSEPRIGL